MLPSLSGTYVISSPLSNLLLFCSLYKVLKKKKSKKKKGGLLGDIPVAGSETDVHQRWERNFSGANAGHKPGSHQEANSAGKGICKGAWYQRFPKQGVMLHPWLGFTGQKLWGNAGSNPGVGTEMGGLGRLHVEWS